MTICDFRYSLGFLLVGAVRVAPDHARGFGPSEIGRQVAAGVRGADAQAGELVERPVEDQARQEVGRFERIADDVAEIAAPVERALFDDVGRAAGMHEDQRAELGGLGPERIVLREREILAVHVPADRGAAQAEPLDPVLELLGRQIGMLQGDRRHRDEAIGVCRHPLRESLVLRPHDPAREVAIGRVPPVAVDAQRLDVDALLIHDLQTLRAEDVRPGTAAHACQRRALDDVLHGDDAVRVHVDHARRGGHPPSPAGVRALSPARPRRRRDLDRRSKTCTRPPCQRSLL